MPKNDLLLPLQENLQWSFGSSFFRLRLTIPGFWISKLATRILASGSRIQDPNTKIRELARARGPSGHYPGFSLFALGHQNRRFSDQLRHML